MDSRELWKDIPNYPGYQASDQGRIRSLEREITDKNGRTKNQPGKVLNSYSTKGYRRVSLYTKMGRQCELVHRLVAECFIPNPENKLYVNHINGCKTDNAVTNLEWVTATENMIHAYKAKLRPIVDTKGEENGFAKLTENAAKEVKKLALLGILTQKEIAARFNISRSTVRDIKLERRWKHLA